MCIINESYYIIMRFNDHHWNQFQKCFSTVYDMPMFRKCSFLAILALIMHNLCDKSLIMQPLYTKLPICLSLTIWKTHAKFGIERVCRFREKVEQIHRFWVIYRWYSAPLYLFNREDETKITFQNQTGTNTVQGFPYNIFGGWYSLTPHCGLISRSVIGGGVH